MKRAGETAVDRQWRYLWIMVCVLGFVASVTVAFIGGYYCGRTQVMRHMNAASQNAAPSEARENARPRNAAHE